MAIRLSTEGSSFRVYDTTANIQILEEQKFTIRPILEEDTTTPANDAIRFSKLTFDQSEASFTSLSKDRTFLRTDLVNGDDGDALFANMNALRTYLGASTGFSTASGGSGATGWASYVDTEYDSGSPFLLAQDSEELLPNNSGITINSQMPTYFSSFYENDLITGRNGDGISINIQLIARPTTNATNIRIGTSIDIGGTIGQIFRFDQPLTRGNGVDHYYLKSFSAYTLGTWAVNGGAVYVNCINSDIEIYGISYLFHNLHRAR